ncbi:MAG: CvpA family protein [Alphaproteobacteria bacterium]
MIVDILVLIVIALSALIAFLRGFIREIFTILNVVGALAAAYYGGGMLLPLMEGWLGVDPAAEDPQRLFDIIPYTIIAQILSYGAIFILVVIILSIISHFLAETVRSIGLGAIDRTLGVIFGILRGVLLIGLLYLPLHLSVNGTDEEEQVEQWFEGSKTYLYIEGTADFIARFVPEDAKKAIERNIEDGAEKAEESGMREKLEQMEILPGDKKDSNNPEEERKEGYTPEFREEMDRLFEQETDNNEQ